MKTCNHLFILFVMLLLPIGSIYAHVEQVPVEGEWGDDRTRSFVPASPAVSISDNLLSIYFADPLEDVTIVVTDGSGAIVYQDCITVGGGYTLPIVLSEQPQGYTIEITHQYGYLTGWFKVGL